MNPSTIIGMFLGLVLLLLAVTQTTEDATVFINLPGLAIVLGGTLAATFLSYPIREVIRSIKVFIIILRTEEQYTYHDLKEIVTVAQMLFGSGNIARVEEQIENIKNPFLATGMQMVVDNVSQEEIAELMEWRIAQLEAKEAAEAQVYRTMAMFAPAFGMFGTLIGLINLLRGLEGHGIEFIGLNMGMALLTTLYGVVLANLVFKPIAIKFERRTEQRVMLMRMVLEGVSLMSRNYSPAFIKRYLEMLLANHEDDLRQMEKNKRLAKTKRP